MTSRKWWSTSRRRASSLVSLDAGTDAAPNDGNRMGRVVMLGSVPRRRHVARTETAHANGPADHAGAAIPRGGRTLACAGESKSERNHRAASDFRRTDRRHSGGLRRIVVFYYFIFRHDSGLHLHQQPLHREWASDDQLVLETANGIQADGWLVPLLWELRVYQGLGLLLFTEDAFCSASSHPLALSSTGTAFLNTISEALTYFLPVQIFVRTVVGSQCGACEGNTSKEPAWPRISDLDLAL